jgi:MerR family transcriptional regulator, light-induced transcriptional regulator
MDVLSRSSAETSPELSIGELSLATGVATATLRAWEARHGFPAARRTATGHRRYDRRDVPLVLDVQHRRAQGVRLGAAIQRALLDASATPPAAVYADLARRHPAQPRQRLRKSTLLAISWAIEDEVAMSAPRGELFGAFQTVRNFEKARVRWDELARVSSATLVFADFPASDGAAERRPGALTRVALPEDAPMRREWTVVCNSQVLPVALAAWELPQQDATPDRDRLFESIWTVDPAAVRDAALSCARAAAATGDDSAARLLSDIEARPAAPDPDLLTVARLVHRIVAYVEDAAHR